MVQTPRAFDASAKVARQAVQVARPGVHGHVGKGPVRESQPDPGHRRDDRADRTEGRLRPRIEPFEGLRETSTPLRPERAKEILGTSWGRGAELRRRLIEVAEEATALVRQELQVRGAEPVAG